MVNLVFLFSFVLLHIFYVKWDYHCFMVHNSFDTIVNIRFNRSLNTWRNIMKSNNTLTLYRKIPNKFYRFYLELFHKEWQSNDIKKKRFYCLRPCRRWFWWILSCYRDKKMRRFCFSATKKLKWINLVLIKTSANKKMMVTIVLFIQV